ncbi:thermolabile L-asparaginase [Aspergillus luchuensis]|uniref:Thermolabile L-asparaginase n=1 Tax=Aspergillus kawachii TaxID=1069201 RepID=A0A146EX57_ASPKA|nr:thermolabile L-asparaginase [Aspergillus luchuensis]
MSLYMRWMKYKRYPGYANERNGQAIIGCNLPSEVVPSPGVAAMEIEIFSYISF